MLGRLTAGTMIAALWVLAAAPVASAAPPLDLAGADALAATHGGGRNDLLKGWASKASLAELLFVLRRPPAELGEAEGLLVEAALDKAGADRRALRTRLLARLALLSPGKMKKLADELAEAGGPPPRPRASVFRVATLLPGSGSYESYGRAVRLGLQYALAEARNASEPAIELRDWPTGEDDPGRVAAALDSALESSAVVVGELLSVPTVSLATGARMARAVVVSPTATDESVGAVGPGVFQIGPSAARRAAALARAIKESSPRGIGVLHSTETGHRGLGERFVAAAESLKLSVVWHDTYAPGAEDFKAAVRSIVDKNVDVLFWDGDSREADALLRELALQKVAVRMCGGEELSPDQYHAETRAMLEGARHVTEDWQISTRVMARLDSVARAAGEERASPLHVRGYLAGRFIVAAVRQGALCPEELAAALAARVERADGEPELRFLDCATEGGQLPVFTVSHGRSVGLP
jgi:ABC-type branched-subunit amino acid transport system substrate-binding protein